MKQIKTLKTIDTAATNLSLQLFLIPFFLYLKMFTSYTIAKKHKVIIDSPISPYYFQTLLFFSSVSGFPLLPRSPSSDTTDIYCCSRSSGSPPFIFLKLFQRIFFFSILRALCPLCKPFHPTPLDTFFFLGAFFWLHYLSLFGL